MQPRTILATVALAIASLSGLFRGIGILPASAAVGSAITVNVSANAPVGGYAPSIIGTSGATVHSYPLLFAVTGSTGSSFRWRAGL
jgi:hypothetical protein